MNIQSAYHVRVEMRDCGTVLVVAHPAHPPYILSLLSDGILT